MINIIKERKMLMAEKDIAMKMYLKKRVRYADIYNAVMFGGRQVIKAEELTELNSESSFIIDGIKLLNSMGKKNEKNAKRAVWRYRDIIMKWHGMLLMVLACEVQDKIHHAMPVRGMLYDALSYTDQISRIREKSDNAGKSLDSAEFFSGFGKTDRLCPVVTLVLYYGKEEWNGSLELYDMFGFEDEADRKFIERFVNNYKVNIVDVSKIEDLSIYQSDLKEVFGLIKCRNDKNKLLRYINDNRKFFETVDYETVNAIGAMLDGGEKYTEMFKNMGKEEETNMCQALEDLWSDGVKEGEARGIKLGEERGIKLGEERGIKLGEERGIKLGEISGIKKSVFMLRKVGTADDIIIDMIKSEYNITAEEAEKYIK